MIRRENELQGNPKATGMVVGVLAGILVGFSQMHCLVDAVLSVAVRVALRALPDVLLSGWHLLQTVEACGKTAIWEEMLRISGSWWPTVAVLLTC